MSNIRMSPIDFHDLFVRVYVLMVGLAFGLGAVIIGGGQRRFSAPSFKGPRDLADMLPLFSPYTWWGLLFLCYGIALVIGVGRPVAIHVLRFGIVVFLFFAVALFWSVQLTPVAALTGIVVYTVVALLFAILQDHLHGHGWAQ